MMTEQETTDFGTQIARRLEDSEAVEAIARDICEKMPMLDAAHFQAWARLLVNGPPGTCVTHPHSKYRERLQKLNVLLAKQPEFVEVITRYHTAKNAATPAP